MAQNARLDGPNETALAAAQGGLIYVNPEGPMGALGPNRAAYDICKIAVAKMVADARAAVALIGGGRAFGKAHGTCPEKERDELERLPSSEAHVADARPGVCKCPSVGDGTTGTGLSTWADGFECLGTRAPAQWSNEFFVYLIEKERELRVGPGGNDSWRMEDKHRMRLTSDTVPMAGRELKHWLDVFAQNATALDEAPDAARGS